MNLQPSKIKASRTKTAWKGAENSKKKAEKSVNLRANFDKNKKASRIKALQEFTMKRLTDFFGEKDWKTVEIRYNENMKRSKHCCWTVPMRDWNRTPQWHLQTRNQLNRTYERLKLAKFLIKVSKTLVSWTVPTSEQCALYTVINVDEKERKPEQLMSVRQIWIVRVFIFLLRLCIVY